MMPTAVRKRNRLGIAAELPPPMVQTHGDAIMSLDAAAACGKASQRNEAVMAMNLICKPKRRRTRGSGLGRGSNDAIRPGRQKGGHAVRRDRRHPASAGGTIDRARRHAGIGQVGGGQAPRAAPGAAVHGRRYRDRDRRRHDDPGDLRPARRERVPRR